MISQEFGKWMRVKRAEKDLRKSELADEIGVHENSIRRWEKGSQFPPLDMAEKIVKALGSELIIE